jgi:hypothetical protein
MMARSGQETKKEEDDPRGRKKKCRNRERHSFAKLDP